MTLGEAIETCKEAAEIHTRESVRKDAMNQDQCGQLGRHHVQTFFYNMVINNLLRLITQIIPEIRVLQVLPYI